MKLRIKQLAQLAFISFLIWNVSDLVAEKTNIDNSKFVRSIKKTADIYCTDSIVLITDKQNTFAPDSHYYCSIGPYWWPDPNNPEHYIRRDGKINPERSKFDREKLSTFANKCFDLSRAFYLTEDNVYYSSFIKQLEAWFIDQSTFMYPNFEYAQVIPGRGNNKGRSTGFIDAYDFNTVIESIRLVNSIKMIDKNNLDAIKEWFLDFATWAEGGDYGKSLRETNNNIGVAYDVTLINMYLFGGNVERAKAIADSFAERRLAVQIMEDGSQPAELKRTNAFSYSLYNLMHIVDFCYLVRVWYPNYYKEHQELIDKAFVFLSPFTYNPESFPYQQISGWDNCKKNFEKQIKRLNDLSK